MLQVSNAQHRSIRAWQNWGAKDEIGEIVNANQKNGKHGQVHLCDAKRNVDIYCLHAYKAYVFKSSQLRSNFEAFAPGQSSKAQSPGSAHALNQRPMNEENIKMTNSEEGTVWDTKDSLNHQVNPEIKSRHGFIEGSLNRNFRQYGQLKSRCIAQQ